MSDIILYHNGKQGGNCDFCNFVSKEKPQESVEGHHQETINCDSHYLRFTTNGVLKILKVKVSSIQDPVRSLKKNS